MNLKGSSNRLQLLIIQILCYVQNHVYFVLILGPVPLSQSTIKLLDKVKPKAAQCMFTSTQILAELYGRSAILSRHSEELESVEMRMTGSKKNLMLIEIMQRRSNDAFEVFLDVLKENSQSTAVDIFKTGKPHFNIVEKGMLL